MSVIPARRLRVIVLVSLLAVSAVVLRQSFIAKTSSSDARRNHNIILNIHGSQVWDIPPLDNVHMFHEDSARYGLDTPAGISEWNATLPSGGVLLHLGPTLSEPYTLSMFHQYRCLNIIREAIVDLYANTSADAHISGRQEEVVTHCMNYVRQMILCRADMRLENVRARQMTVADVTHTCKDWAAVYQAAEENHRSFRERHVQRS